MRKTLFLFALLLTQPLAAFYGGVGLGWNTVDETFNSNLHTNEDRSGRDRYEASMNRFAPVVQLGHQFAFCNDWAVGILAQWNISTIKPPTKIAAEGKFSLMPRSPASIYLVGTSIEISLQKHV